MVDCGLVLASAIVSLQPTDPATHPGFVIAEIKLPSMQANNSTSRYVR